MTKLYYTSTSCGAASFIAAFTAGVKLEAEQVNIQTHVTASGADFYAINSKGNVPTLVLNDGTVLNENTAILQYIADQVRQRQLKLYGNMIIATLIGTWSCGSRKWYCCQGSVAECIELCVD